MPDLRMQLPQVPDAEWQDAQFAFNGAWMPDLDPALIGAENFATLQNLRYKDKGLEGVSGYAYVNDTTALDTYIYVRNGIQLRSPFTATSYVLVHATDDSNPGRVFVNTTAIGTEGDFDQSDDEAVTINLDPTGKPSAPLDDTDNSIYIVDSSAGLEGRFSLGPQATAIYCNGEQTKIFSGYEARIAAAFLCMDQTGTSVVDVTEDISTGLTTRKIGLSENLVNNGDCEAAATGWTALDAGTTTNERSSTVFHSGAYSWKIVCVADEDGTASDAFAMTTAAKYWFSGWFYSAAETEVGIQILDGDGSSLYNTDHTIIAAQWNHITFDVTSVTGGSSAQVIVKATAASGGGTWYFDDIAVVPDGYFPELHILTTRPIQGLKYYIDSGDENETASAQDIEWWSGAGFSDVTDDEDGTLDGTVTFAQSGFYRFAHTGGNADGTATAGNDSTLASYVKLRHFQELYMYAYRIRLTAGNVLIYQITADYGFQPVQNIWDGVYREPIQFQFYDISEDAWEDYTLFVNQSSDINAPIGALLDAMSSTDYIIMMFEDQMAAVNFTMLGTFLNKAASVMVMYYWNGHEWTQLTKATHGWADDTKNDLGTKTFTKSGLVSWNPPTDEEKQTLFNTFGYAYKIMITGGPLTDTAAGKAIGDEDVVIDLVTGIPSTLNSQGLPEVEAFDFAAKYRNRVMLCSYSAGGERNRMDYSAENAPDVWNGDDTSDNGRYALYFGDETKITAATQIYNRFGSNIFAMFLVLKDAQTYVLTGSNPDDFQIFPVSLNVGCPAPLTLATAEMGFEGGEGIQRQVAIWVSHSGPVMFDGAVLIPIRGIDIYFDPNEDEFVNWDYMSLSRGWVDNVFKEYNLLLPSGSTSTSCNVWLCYDLIRKKWFKKDVGTAEFPQSGWNVVDTTGEQGVYAGIDTGQIIETETGNSWACTYDAVNGGSGIQQIVRTGDFFPSNNIWDECLIRKFKLICEKLAGTSLSVFVNVNYYENAANSAADVTWADTSAVEFTDLDADGDGVKEVVWASAAEATLDLDLDVGTDRLVRLIQDLNQRGWLHSFEFEITTSDVAKGWKPIAWGIRYRVDRKDDTATD